MVSIPSNNAYTLNEPTTVSNPVAIAVLGPNGQLTLPQAVCNALGVREGSKIAFELRQGEVLLRRAQAEHEDPSLQGYLRLLEKDIASGRNLHGLPESLTKAMAASAGHDIDLDEDIEGDVAL